MEMETTYVKQLGCRNGASVIQMLHPMEADLLYEVSAFGYAGEDKSMTELRLLTPVKAKTLKSLFNVAIDKDARILLGKLDCSRDDKPHFTVVSNVKLAKMSSESVQSLQVLIRESTSGAFLDVTSMEKNLNEGYGKDARFKQLRANKLHSQWAHWTIRYRIYDLEAVVSSVEEMVTAYMLLRETTDKLYDYSHGYMKMSSHDVLEERRRRKELEKLKESEQQDLHRRLERASA